MTGTLYENWAEGSAYEQFMGRWSVEVATLFLEWLPIPAQAKWLDIGCGTGALTRSILQQANPSTIIGIDRSLNFATYAKQGTIEASFITANGNALPLKHKVFDVVVSGLALNFISEPAKALQEMHRIVRDEGIVAAYVWDYAGQMEFLRYFWDVAVTLDPSAVARHEGNRFPLCQPEALQQLWVNSGFKQIEITGLVIPTVFDNFAHYWESFTVGHFPAPQYVMSLDEDQRNAFCDHLYKTLPSDADGSVRLVARAWAIRGIR